MYLSTGIRAYEQLGYRAFGTPGKMAAGIAITLQNIGGEAPECLSEFSISKQFFCTLYTKHNYMAGGLRVV